MHNKLLLASVGAIALSGSAALAAEPLPPPPPPPPPFTWTGPYVGGQIGYAWAANGSFNDFGFDPRSRIFFTDVFGATPNGVLGGAHVGAQYQFDWLVLGIEGSVDGTSLTATDSVTFPVAFRGGTLSAQISSDIQGSIRGKIGVAWDRLLIYGTGGVAFGGFTSDFTLSAPGFTPTPIFASFNTSSTRTGWTAGGGLQYAVTNNWWVFAEYRFSDFGTLRENLFGLSLPANAFLNGSRRLEQNDVQVGFSYRFELLPPPPPVVAKY